MTGIEELIEIAKILQDQLKDVASTIADMMQKKLDRATTLAPSYYSKYGAELKLWSGALILNGIQEQLKQSLNKQLEDEFGAKRMNEAVARLVSQTPRSTIDPDATPEIREQLKDLIEHTKGD